MSYQPSIELVLSDFETQVENDMVKCVQRYGFNVDREELRRALMYDRRQYDKGYADGKADAEGKIIHCKDCRHLGEVFPSTQFGHTAECWHWMQPVLLEDWCSRGEKPNE